MEDEKKKRISYKKIWQMLRPFIGRLWYWYAMIVLLSVILGVIPVVEPFLYGRIIDRLLVLVAAKSELRDAFAAMFPLLLWWGALSLGEISCYGIWNYLGWFTGNKMSALMAVELYRKMLSLDVIRFHEEKGGELLRRFDNAWEAAYQVTNQFVRTYLNAVISVLLAYGIGFWLDWRLALISLVPVIVNVTVAIFEIRISEHDQRNATKIWDEASGRVGDSFDNITSMKAFSGEERSVSFVESAIEKARGYQNRVNIKWALGEGIADPMLLLGRLSIIAIGSMFVLQGSATVGTVISFLGFMTVIYTSVQRVAFSLPELIRNLSRLDRAVKFWEEVPVIRNNANALNVKRLAGDVKFERVNYRYRDGKDVLHGVDIHIPTGQTYALVGESGAGKSTLAQMLMRFHDPKSGRIVIDGHDIRDLDLESLRKNIGFVMQENLLFHDTILSNLKFAKPNATEKEIIEAAKRAQAHDFIKRLKNGYKTVVGERGVKLSGGEKQRIALARVLLANPPILVLDEATSALDSKTEHALQAALHEVMKDRTSIVIAHRLSTVMKADRILVMDKGRIVDQGTHDQLIKRSGLYKQYWEIQAGGYV